MNDNRILFVDDDTDIRELIRIVLPRAGFSVLLAENGLQALEMYSRNQVGLVILDIMMPNMDGLEVCRRIRQVADTPIILLTARGQEEDVVEGFEAGADDYIVKPVRPKELVARIQAILNRVERQREETPHNLIYKHLTLDLDARRVTYYGKNIPVTPLEFQLLQYLIERQGSVLSKEDLLHNVWGYAKAADDINLDMNLIEAAIKRLRKKIESDPSRPQYIQTVWGTGYRMGD